MAQEPIKCLIASVISWLTMLDYHCDLTISSLRCIALLQYYLYHKPSSLTWYKLDLKLNVRRPRI